MTTGVVMVLATVAEGWSQVALWSLWIGSGFLAVWLASPVGKGIEILTRALAGGITLMFKSLADAVDAWAKAKRALVSGLAEIKAEVGQTKVALDETKSKVDMNTQAITDAERKATEEAKRLADEERDRRHKLADQLQATVNAQSLEIAQLKETLGLTGATHADAINTVADDVQVIADRMRPPVEVHDTHVEPISQNGEQS